MSLRNPILAALCSTITCTLSHAASPRIDDLSTNGSVIAEEIIIFGDDFLPDSAVVLVGGMPAPVLSGNVGYLRVRVPGGGLPGPVFVIEDGKVAASSKYFDPRPSGPGTLTNNFAERELSRKAAFLPLGAVADFDQDGQSDVVVARQNSLEIFHNESSDGLLTSNSFSSVSFPLGTAPFSLVIGDLNGDGKPDLIYTQGDTLVARQNQITDTGIGPESFLFPVVLQPRNVFRPLHIADADHDGRPDILAANPSAGILVFLNRSVGATFKKTDFTNTFVIRSNSGLSSKGVLDFDVADLNQDGHPDIAAVIGTNLVLFALQDESGQLRTNFISSFVLGPARTGLIEYAPGALAIADLNGDGIPDLVVSEPGNIVAYLNHSRPDHFDASSFERFVLVSSGYNFFLVGDFDGDGRMELLVENRMIFKIHSGDGQLISNTGRDRILLQSDLSAFALGDLNNDNRTDIVGLRRTEPLSFVVLQNLGVPSPPRLVLRQSGVRRTLSVTGQPMSTFHLQTSADLIHWQTTADLRLTMGGEMNYIDPNSEPKTFFRLVQ